MLDIVTVISDFKPLHCTAHTAHSRDFIFIFDHSQCAVTPLMTLPCAEDLGLTGHTMYVFGLFQGRYCCFYEDPIHPEWMIHFHPIRSLQGKLPEVFYVLSSLAHHLHHWRSMHQFCGRCGARAADIIHERAKICTVCSSIVYPRISPCVIVLIRRGHEILLLRSPHFRPGVYSLVAGFIEPGETVEQALHREVLEETGIIVQNLRYIASQPWPFPDSLMIGFVADYREGVLKIDGQEIENGGWFTAENLPDLPHEDSISRYLIDSFFAGAFDSSPKD